MIQPLRRVHRYVFLALVVCLPLLIALALLGRAPRPVQVPWPFDAERSAR